MASGILKRLGFIAVALLVWSVPSMGEYPNTRHHNVASDNGKLSGFDCAYANTFHGDGSNLTGIGVPVSYPLPIDNGGTGSGNATGARANLGLDNASNYPTLNQNTTGTAANLSGTPALPDGTTATTQAGGDNSTKLATTAYADAAVGSGSYQPLEDQRLSTTDSPTFAGLTTSTINTTTPNGQRGFSVTNDTHPTDNLVMGFMHFDNVAKRWEWYDNVAGTWVAIDNTAINLPLPISIDNGGTGATTAAGARTNLGLGSLAVVTPSGTPNGAKYLRDDNTWETPAGTGGGTTTTPVGGGTSYGKNNYPTHETLISRSLVFDGATDVLFYAVPAIVKTANSNLLVFAQEGTTENDNNALVYKVSANGGRTWSTKTLLQEGSTYRHWMTGSIMLANNNLLAIYNRATPTTIYPGIGIYGRISTDNGYSFGSEFTVFAHGDNGYYSPFSNCTPIQLPSGELLLAIGAQADNVIPPNYGNSRSLILSSDNSGTEWSLKAVNAVGYDNIWQEQSLAVLDNGTIINLMRGEDAANQPYQTWAQWSYDNAVTWTAPVSKFPSSGKPNVHKWSTSPNLVNISRNVIEQDYHARVRFSNNGGGVWSDNEYFDLNQKGGTDIDVYGASVEWSPGVLAIATASYPVPPSSASIWLRYMVDGAGIDPLGTVHGRNIVLREGRFVLLDNAVIVRRLSSGVEVGVTGRFVQPPWTNTVLAGGQQIAATAIDLSGEISATASAVLINYILFRDDLAGLVYGYFQPTASYVDGQFDVASYVNATGTPNAYRNAAVVGILEPQTIYYGVDANTHMNVYVVGYWE